ncbi:MAG: DUF1684 domain-containing protein, partial [Williamsia herbipolensis]|nr:DUF1684 domain-containing protein [Williamsia herbipolensis]
MSTDLSAPSTVAPATAYPVSEWAAWHAGRERTLQEEHGWLSLTAFHWLPQQEGPLAGLPGRWQADGATARVRLTDADGVALWDQDSASVDGPLEATVDEQGSLRWLHWGDRQIELARRGGRYAIRVRDPHASTRTAFTGVPTFPLDPAWVRPATVMPRAHREIVEVDTARTDLRQQARIDADVVVELPDGTTVELAATVGEDGSVSILFHDSSNGAQTAAWRVLFGGVPDAEGRLTLDFNRALNMPYSFTEFGTCPAPVPTNRIPIPVTAGEKA